ncbi:MAG: MFS transporter, partial [Deltaproteobacteria bacterium]|nr:MFS transporter [Deltaproteobacteria bacterium]
MDPGREKATDWSGVAFGLMLGLLAAYQQFKLPPALPLLLQRFGYTRAVAGGFMSVYAVAGLLVSVPAGRVLARRGPRGILAAAFSLFLAGNALALALPSSSAAMLASRLLEGLGFSVAAVVGAVVAVSSASLRHRPVALALWATWIPVGQVVGTALAIPTVSAGHWRPLWWFSAGATLALWAWGLRLGARGCPALAPPPASGGPAPADPRQSVVLRERRLLIALAAALFGLWSSSYITYVTWLPQYLVEAHGFTPGAAARAYLIPSVLVILANLGAGVILRGGTTAARLLGGSLAVQTAVWFLIPVTQGPVSGVVSLVVYGVAAGLTATALFALPGEILGPAASQGFAPMMAGRNVGVLAGP